MGICLSPESRANTSNNKLLKELLIKELNNIQSLNFAIRLLKFIPKMKDQFMLNEQILNQIDNVIHDLPRNAPKTAYMMSEQMKKSCLVMEDEWIQQNKDYSKDFSKDYRSHRGFSTKVQVQEKKSSYSKLNDINETQHQFDNQSLICQINILYQREFDVEKYSSALSLFLKWSKMFDNHLLQYKFLKPIYYQFYESIYQMGVDDFQQMVNQCSIFVNYLVAIYTNIYKLKLINQSQHGFLFKNQNIYNLIMTNIFKKSKLTKFIRQTILTNQQQKINRFKQKLNSLQNTDMEYFKIQPPFRLHQTSQLTVNSTHNRATINKSFGNDSFFVQTSPVQPYVQPYSECIQLIKNICQNSQSPVSKLKLIVQISKQITNEIYKFYDKIHQEVPQLDPDNLTSIIMYLIVKANNPNLFLQIKITQNFTTSNCLASISGYYLNTFSAAIQYLLQL